MESFKNFFFEEPLLTKILPKSDGHQEILPAAYWSSLIVDAFLSRVHGILLTAMDSLETLLDLTKKNNFIPVAL